MRQFLIRRLLLVVPMLLAVSFIAFALGELSPSDPAEVAIRVNAMVPTDELIAEVRHELGLDRPFLVRYFDWLCGVIQGDLGHSFVTGRAVTEDFLLALPATLKLASATLCIIVVISFLVGIIGCVFAETAIDKVLRASIFLLSATPSFWAALLLIWLFAVKLNWLPTSGMRTAESVILPATALSLAYVSTYARLIRVEMINNAQTDWVLFARGRGISETRIIAHILRNSLRATVTALGMSIPKLIAGAFVIENIFAWPGIGRLCVSAVFNRDLPIITAYALVMAILFIVFNLLADATLLAMNPRARHSSEESS